jgi:glucose-1-phosphate cytidylyltransferase
MGEDIPVVILAGGKGMRMSDHEPLLPKALVRIGPYPVILHVMKIYAFYGFKRFIIAIGHKGEKIKEFFKNLEWTANDFTLRLGGSKKVEMESHLPSDWLDYTITFAETGEDTMTGGRVKKVEKYIDTDDFFVTYCDGLANINIRKEYEFHKKKGKMGTLTLVRPMSPFGVVELGEDGIVKSFREKPFMDTYINGGFFVFKRKFLDRLGENSVLEEEPMRALVAERQLAGYPHDGFWACMDTGKDVMRLNELWRTGVMPHTGYRAEGKVAPWFNLEK